MKTIIVFLTVAFLLGGWGGSTSAYEGGTKFVAAMNQPDRGKIESRQPLISDYGYGGTKLVVRFLHRMPEPTLSIQRIREEKAGLSLGTKPVVRFQKERGL